MWKRGLVGATVLALVAASAYASLFIAPTERTMGLIQRIFYFHAASAWAGMTAFSVCFGANLLYVWRRQPKWDSLGVSAAEVGLAFITIVLITGPIWAKPVWGIWWAWDARLTSTLVLWLLYISFLLLRDLIADPDRRSMFSAIYGIFLFLDVPLVYFSIRIWRTQHPQPVILGGQGSGLDPTMRKVFYLCWLALTGVMVILIRQRYQLERARNEVEELRIEAERQTSVVGRV